MHHFIFPSKDTYITDRTGLDDKNFGICEILKVGTLNTPQRTLSATKDYSYTDVLFNNQQVVYFTGIFTGSMSGTTATVNGTMSGSGLEFSSSYFSGSVDGSISEISGSVSGSLIDGIITGSFYSIYKTGLFTGQLSGSVGCLTGTGSGIDTRNEYNWTTTNEQFVDRSLLHFNLTEISKSIVSGAIVNPRFSVKLKVCNEYDLPIAYDIYAYPISQSWNMGDGYLSDGGSDTGVSWLYRDNNYGTEWTGSVGGGTWFTSSVCSQSFEYQSSDINMDVTTMVNKWLNGSVVNEGMILLSSDEFRTTGSGFTLTFFSRDTNTIYSPYLDVMWNDISQSGYITGSQSTSSVVITLMSSGITASVQSGSSFYIDGGIVGTFSGSTYLDLTVSSSGTWDTLFTEWELLDWTWDSGNSTSTNTNYWVSTGFVDGMGLTGNIVGIPGFGNISGSITISQSLVTGPCGKSFSASLAQETFTSGIFSGSTFTAYYVDHKFENAIMTGSWTEAALLGAKVTIPLPSAIAPYAYAYVKGTYVNGKALGLYTTSGSTSASFAGQFVDGNLLGGVLNLQLSGSVTTSSYYYTSSVEMTSSAFIALDSHRPFTIVLQNVNPTYKAGDIVRIGVFGRKQFPLKTFGKSTQQVQYIVPEYLPTSSFYALKDNETDEIVMNFDSYTQIGCSYPEGNYFVIDTTSLPQDRYYKILIRVDDGQSIYTIDCGKTFKITR
jgi:hypothetical protein